MMHRSGCHDITKILRKNGAFEAEREKINKKRKYKGCFYSIFNILLRCYLSALDAS